MTNKNTHILFFCSWFKTPDNKIIGSFFEEQARMLLKRGYKVGIINPEFESQFFGNSRFKKKKEVFNFVDDGLPIYYSRTQSIIPKYENLNYIDLHRFYYEGFSAYKSYVTDYGKPDIIHAQSVLYAGILARKISLKERIPYVVSEHFSKLILDSRFSLKNTLINKMIIKTYKEAHALFSVSNFLKEKLVENFNLDCSDVVVLPNIVNDFFFKNTKVKLDKDYFVITVLANLIELKNHITLFKAIKILIANNLKIRLNVVGNGPVLNNLVLFIEKNNLENSIILMGFKSRKEVHGIIRNSHGLISASLFETFGVNLIEALAVGRPVIAYDSGGPRDIIRDFNGLLVSDNTPEAFVKSIIKLKNNYENYNQEAISKDCKNRFSESVIFNKLIKFYSRIN
jgi:glycosyltransferase involved in cell wall biosynthesis